jgi:hypothetical protein
MPTASHSRIQWLKSFDRVTIHNQRDEKKPSPFSAKMWCGRYRTAIPPPAGAPPPVATRRCPSASILVGDIAPSSAAISSYASSARPAHTHPESNQHRRIGQNRSRMLTSPRRLARTERRRYLRRSESAGRRQAGADADLTHPTPARGGGAGGGGSSLVLFISRVGWPVSPPPRSDSSLFMGPSLITIAC